MAFDGPIDFLSPGGGKVDWSEDIILPFAEHSQGPFLLPIHQSESPTSTGTNGDLIRAVAFDFKVAFPGSKDQEVFYTDGSELGNGQTKCVFIATTKDKKDNYVMLVSAATQSKPAVTHERVGVARLLYSCLDRSKGVKVTIG